MPLKQRAKSNGIFIRLSAMDKFKFTDSTTERISLEWRHLELGLHEEKENYALVPVHRFTWRGLKGCPRRFTQLDDTVRNFDL